MKHLRLIAPIFGLLFIKTSLSAQTDELISLNTETEISSSGKEKRLNFFIISSPKKGKLDLASRFNIIRGKIKSLFRRKKFVAIVAKDLQIAASKIQYRLKKFNAVIGTLWFDSHGSYKKGYSIFYIGRNEFNYHSVQDTDYVKPLKDISVFANENSKIVIGSCYGGATFMRKSLHGDDTIRMNGDSLMIGLGKIFSRSSIFASESWVMTKPGLFLQRASVAGHPMRRLFKDVVYRPAWENMGKWNEYNALTKDFSSVNPVTMDMYGNVMMRFESYSGKDNVKKEVKKNIKKLRPGLLKMK